MERKRNWLADYAVYVVVRLVITFIQTLPYSWGLKLADGLAWLAYRVNRRHRLVALDNLTHAFGDSLTAEQRDHIVRNVYRHFCRMLIDMLHLPRRLQAGTLRDLFEFDKAGEFLDQVMNDRPAMVVTGHLGNWEAAGFFLGLVGCKMYPIARKIDNPYLDAWLRDFRERTGQEVLDKNEDYDRMQEVLASRKDILVTLCDQDAGQKGQFVDFFGRPASTHKAIAIMSLGHDVPLVITAVVVAPDTGKFRVLIADRIDPRDYADRPDAVQAITQRFTAAMDRMVREYPEQYFWLHRRWKHQPKVRERKKVAA